MTLTSSVLNTAIIAVCTRNYRRTLRVGPRDSENGSDRLCFVAHRHTVGIKVINRTSGDISFVGGWATEEDFMMNRKLTLLGRYAVLLSGIGFRVAVVIEASRSE
jgi:hypothetical protein